MIVEEFLRWVRTAPMDARVDATRALANAYLYSDMDEATLEAAEAALTTLLDDGSISVRRMLAETLAASPLAPRHIIRELAADQPDIAAPVLARSPVLLDAELVDIVGLCDPRCQTVIAGRAKLSPTGAAAIAEVGDLVACIALADNGSARLALATCHRLVERFGADPTLRDALLARRELPLEIRQRLISRLGDALSAFVTDRAWMPKPRAETVTRDACDKATVTIAMDASDREVETLVAHLRASGALTTSLILRAICLGEIRFFEAALSNLSGLPRKRVFSLLERGNDGAFRALYEKAKLPPSALPAFRAALHLLREMRYENETGNRYRFAQRMIERILTKSDDIGDIELDRLLAMLRRFAADAARDVAREYAERCAAA